MSAPASARPTPLTSASDHAERTAQRYTWEWTDGYDGTRRTFSESEYGTAANLPRLKVRAYPAWPSQRVVLTYLQDGAWHRESSNATNSIGVATMKLYPYATGGRWADGTWRYKVRVEGTDAWRGFQITYRP